MSDRWHPTRRTLLQAGVAVPLGSSIFGRVGAQTIDSPDDESWPQFGYDDGNTGYASANTGPTDRVIEEWLFTMRSGEQSQQSGDPVVVDGTIYLGSTNGTMYAVDAEDGSEQWSTDVERDIESAPAVVDGTAYVGSKNGDVYAFDTGDGTERWQFATGDTVYRENKASASGLDPEGEADTYTCSVRSMYFSIVSVETVPAVPM